MARWLTYLKSPWTIILVGSVLLFTFWGGPVFTATALSHGGRLLVSYLFIPVAVSAVLLWQRRWEWASCGYYTVSLALIKMVITMGVHLWVVPRGERLEARAVQVAGVSEHYQGVRQHDFGTIVGSFEGTAAGGFVALLEVKRGKPSSPRVHDVEQEAGGFRPAFVVATLHDGLQLRNSDSRPHAFVLSDSAGQMMQVPLPPGRTAAARTLVRTGRFESHCSYDPDGERLPVWVFEHPYHALLDPDGNFRLDSVPAGTFHLGVWSPEAGPKPAWVDTIHLARGTIDTVVVPRVGAQLTE
jgi:hypothetical protein